MKFRIVKTAAVIFAVLALAACGKHNDTAFASSAEKEKEKEYVVGTGATYAPFEYENE